MDNNENPNPAEEAQLSPEQQQQLELQRLHHLNFQRFLEMHYTKGQLEGNEEALNMLFKAFAQGFNAGMVHAAGISLMTVGIDLNNLVPRNAAKETVPEPEA